MAAASSSSAVSCTTRTGRRARPRPARTASSTTVADDDRPNYHRPVATVRRARSVVDRRTGASDLKIRSDVLSAATRVFSERGYHGASMQDVADAAGMQKASLYYHVGRKEDLLYAIHEQMMDELTEKTL